MGAQGFDDLESDGVDRVERSHWLLENVSNFFATEFLKLGGGRANHLLIFNFDAAESSRIARQQGHETQSGSRLTRT